MTRQSRRADLFVPRLRSLVDFRAGVAEQTVRGPWPNFILPSYRGGERNHCLEGGGVCSGRSYWKQIAKTSGKPHAGCYHGQTMWPIIIWAIFLPNAATWTSRFPLRSPDAAEFLLATGRGPHYKAGGALMEHNLAAVLARKKVGLNAGGSIIITKCR